MWLSRYVLWAHYADHEYTNGQFSFLPSSWKWDTGTMMFFSPSVSDSGSYADAAFLSFRVWTACLWMRSLTPPCMCMSPQSTAPTSSWASMTSVKRIFSVTWLWSWKGRSSGPTGLCWPHAVNTSGRHWLDRRKMTWWSACLRRYSSLVCLRGCSWRLTNLETVS